MSNATQTRPPRQRQPCPRFCKLTAYPDGSRALVIRQLLSSKREQVDDNRSHSSRRRRTTATTVHEDSGRLPLDGLGSREG